MPSKRKYIAEGPERRTVVSYFGTLNLERVDLSPYTSFDGDVGFSVRRPHLDQQIGVHLAIEDARQFAQGILDVIERHEIAARKPRRWERWRVRHAR